MPGPNPSQTMDVLQWLSENLKPSAGRVNATEDVEPAGFTDMPGVKLEITPAASGILLVWAEVQFNIGVAADSMLMTLGLDGVDQGGSSSETQKPGVAGSHTVMSRSFALSLSAEKHTIKMRVANGAAVKDSGVVAKGGANFPTGFTYLLLAS